MDGSAAHEQAGLEGTTKTNIRAWIIMLFNCTCNDGYYPRLGIAGRNAIVIQDCWLNLHIQECHH